VFQGREWLLAYPKHPPLSMWLVALASELGPARYFAVYLLGQLLAVGGLVLTALLLLYWRGRPAAALTILIGLASPFLTYVPIEVNHNIGVMPFWGLALVAGFFAFERGLLRDWLVFAAAVGFGMWAKYSILHLALPLAVAFIALPEWRRQLATPLPWLAGMLAAALAAPQLVAAASTGGGAFLYALRPNVLGPIENLKPSSALLLNAAALLAFMGLVPTLAAGFLPLRRSVAQSFGRARGDRFTLYLHVALFGPIAIIALSSLFGIRPRVQWLAPIALSAAAWWAEKTPFAQNRLPRSAIVAAGALALLIVTGYAARHFVASLVVPSPGYSDFDGPALARMAEGHWRNHSVRPIPYIVSLDRQRGRQAAGSIVFDSPDRPHVLENADPRLSPWIDGSNLIRRGALVVSPRPFTPADNILGRAIEYPTELERLTVRPFARSRSIYFGILQPAD
jgi:4-amino-4-deoxy-L-arabinose transferase-like glycosyltransferase